MTGKLIPVLLALVAAQALAAPEFGDGWTRDAMARLAAAGLLEGYPDGTFKGDRTATRWEVALVVSRLLTRLNDAQAPLANREDLAAVRALAERLAPELAQLGVRLTRLEQNVARLDRRLREEERISFAGRFETRMVAQSFRSLSPQATATNLVGQRAGATQRPQVQGNVPVVDYRNGRALVTGAGFTSLLYLDVRARLSEELDGSARFAAFTAQGSLPVDAYWGVSAPYLANPFTANAASSELTNQPFTRAVLDQFKLVHKPSKTVAVLGAFEPLRMDPFVYAGQPNLGVFGPKRFPGYGFQVQGQLDELRWEVFGTRFGNGVIYQGSAYQNYVLGADVAYEFAQGHVRLNFARMAEEGSLVGLTAGLNVPYGASPGWSVRQWVNPPGFFVGQVPGLAANVVNGPFLPNTFDTRPIPGWSTVRDNAAGLTMGGGDYGPQDQNSLGLSARHRFDLDSDTWLTVTGEYGYTTYRPSRNSSYQSDGHALRAELAASLMGDALNLDASYLRVDPTYAPAAWSGNVLGIRLVRPLNYTGVFHLHDFLTYPHNREGFRLGARWTFDDKRGSLYARASWLAQTKTSLYDVRSLAAPGGPNFPVLGFSPGFVDPVFSGFAHPLMYGPASGTAFTPGLQPLENPRGSERSWAAGASYRFDRVSLTAGYERTRFHRPSSLPATLGGSQNLVDVTTDYANLEARWDFARDLALLGGVEYVASRGHLDPAGLFNAAALARGATSFPTMDSVQWVPGLGLAGTVGGQVDWSVYVRHYGTSDGVSGLRAHPFSWEGWQVTSQFGVRF